MPRIPLRPLFIGTHRIHVPECASTNELAEEFLTKQIAQEGTVVSTDHQTAGRGQAGNVWVSDPKVNIACSIVLSPSFLELSKQFYLNIITSLAVHDVISSQVRGRLSIKWPNDIMLNDKKVCGILVKNHLVGKSFSMSIVGVGINVNQGSLPFEFATSMSIESGIAFDLEKIYQYLFRAIGNRYGELRDKKLSLLLEDYLANLYQKDELHFYESDEGKFEGTIKGIDELGRLRVKRGTIEKVYSMKEISYSK